MVVREPLSACQGGTCFEIKEGNGYEKLDKHVREEDTQMADRPPDTGDDTGVRPTEDRPPSTPRWVKLSGIIVIFLVLLVVIMMFIGGGDHGPGRHIPSGDLGGDTPLSSVIEDHTPPGGGH